MRRMNGPASSTAPPRRPEPSHRSRYPHFEHISTRWADNDIYGHVNNVVHYSWFDTAVNGYLIRRGALDIHHGSVIGLVVQTQCHYFDAIAFPQTVHAGLRLLHRGRASVQVEVGLFADEAERAAALGHFVHVYVDRASRRPVAELPAALAAALDALRGDALPS
jgi:acyl-CoA thioester hydrolase